MSFILKSYCNKIPYRPFKHSNSLWCRFINNVLRRISFTTTNNRSHTVYTLTQHMQGKDIRWLFNMSLKLLNRPSLYSRLAFSVCKFRSDHISWSIFFSRNISNFERHIEQPSRHYACFSILTRCYKHYNKKELFWIQISKSLLYIFFFKFLLIFMW